MADCVQAPVLEARGASALSSPRHTLLVRLTHWIYTLSFLALLVSGGAILIAHPRLYWGETGGYGSPARIELPLPLNMDQSGWGRSLHFLGAWVAVLNGLVYVLAGLSTRHFRDNLLPARGQLAWRVMRRVFSNQLFGKKEKELRTYNVVQRLAYLGTIFALFPLVILSGLAMSPAVAAALPAIVNSFGGYQSARAVHFFAAGLLVVFVVVHVAMVWRNGFKIRMRAMISGRDVPAREPV